MSKTPYSLQAFFLQLCVVLAALTGTALAAWPPGALVERHFLETPKGYVHYVLRGNVAERAPLVFFHAHPSSAEQLAHIADQIPRDQPFIAVDYFGAGHSDECRCDEAANEFVSFETFASMALAICDWHGALEIIPFGTETGCSPALELAYLASQQDRVKYVMTFDMFYLKPAAKHYVDTVFIPTIRNLTATANGSHLLNFWFEPDAGPIDGLCMINATLTDPSKRPLCLEDVAMNQQKTVDALLAMRTGWQLKMAWTAYNDIIPKRLSYLASPENNVKFLLMSGTNVNAVANKYGLDQIWSTREINKAVPEQYRVSALIDGGTEGALAQNATWMAQTMEKFMGGWPGASAEGSSAPKLAEKSSSASLQVVV